MQIAHGFRFGAFAFDSDSGDLYKDGVRQQRLRDQNRKVLVKLLDQALEIVPNDELIAALWAGTEPAGGLKGIIAELRQALGDTKYPAPAEYIETITGRGHRFLKPVERIEPVKAVPPPVQDGWPDWVKWLIFVIALLIATGAAYWFWRLRTPPPPPEEITITSPLSGQLVDLRQTVAGRVLHPGLPVCVVIHPQGTDGYHNQPNVSPSGDSFSVDAYIGVEGSQDKGRLFDILAITGCTPAPAELTGWPDGTARSKIVTVTRR
jgi:DNA-binding winged helix-turn-helix (wHTH) protein